VTHLTACCNFNCNWNRSFMRSIDLCLAFEFDLNARTQQLRGAGKLLGKILLTRFSRGTGADRGCKPSGKKGGQNWQIRQGFFPMASKRWRTSS